MQGETFWKKVSPCTPFKNFLTKIPEGNAADMGRQSARSLGRAFAIASGWAPPRPHPLRELICFGAGAPRHSPTGCFLDKLNFPSKSQFLVGEGLAPPEGQRISCTKMGNS